MPIARIEYTDHATALRKACMALESEWGISPRVVLACAGGSDEHWQLWHPARCRKGDTPAYTLQGAVLEMHPDCPMLARR